MQHLHSVKPATGECSPLPRCWLHKERYSPQQVPRTINLKLTLLLLYSSTSNKIADFTLVLLEEKLLQYFKNASAINLLLPTASL